MSNSLRLKWSTLSTAVMTLVVATVPLAGFAVEHPASTSAALRLGLSVSPLSGDLGQKVDIEARLENVSSEAVSVFGTLRWGFAGGLILHIEDPAGRALPPPLGDDDLISPSMLTKDGAFVSLGARHFLGVHRTEEARALFPKPGIYAMWVEYISPVPAKFGRGNNFLGREAGVLRSNKVSLEIGAAK